MASTRINKDLAKGVKEYIELELQTEKCLLLIEKNKARQVELISAHKRLGNIVGILRKPTKEAAEAPEKPAEQEKRGRTEESEKEVELERPKKKQRATETTEQNLLRIITRSESSRKSPKTGGIDPRKSIEKGGGKFHSSSHSNPPPVDQ